MTVRPSQEAFLSQNGLETFGAIYGLDAGTAVTDSSSSSVARFVLRDGNERRIVYVKKYWFLRPSRLWKSMLRGTFLRRSKVKREYDFLLQLAQSGLEAAVPIAWGEQRIARWLLRSFLVTEGIARPLPTDGFIAETLPAMPDAERRRARRELLRALAQFIRRFHDHGFVHHDLYWRNIILSEGRLDRFFIIDAPKGRRCWPWESRRCRAKDLATLDAPAPLFFRRTERLRFFLSYSEAMRLTPATKHFVRMILRRAGPERERQGRRILGDEYALRRVESSSSLYKS
jgi:tRNA A-37 threonylcarbamoyl transferase component Bud32